MVAIISLPVAIASAPVGSAVGPGLKQGTVRDLPLGPKPRSWGWQ